MGSNRTDLENGTQGCKETISEIRNNLKGMHPPEQKNRMPSFQRLDCHLSEKILSII